MLTKLQATKARIEALREEHGATDPILVIAAIAVSLVLLVGGSFAVAGIITNGHNLNAKSDLDKVAVAEVAQYAEFDGYVAYDSTAADGDAARALEDSGIGFTPTDGAAIEVVLVGDGWVAASESKSSDGTVYYRSSESSSIVEAIADLDFPTGTDEEAVATALTLDD